MPSPSSVLRALDQASRTMEVADHQRGDPGNPTSRSAGPSPTVNGPTYGYHNTFHLHASLAPPPISQNGRPDRERFQQPPSPMSSNGAGDVLPRYTCTVLYHGELGIKCEMRSPFSPTTGEKWHDIYAVLCGTQLNFHRTKRTTMLSKTSVPCPGKLIRSYTLQHAEIGLASDVKKCDPVPRSIFAKAMPTNARQKLFETDPHLFEPTREWVIRIRVETEQILLCAQTQERMLSWIERISAAIDISPPLEDRTEPRYRSLPRRSRRQRQLELGALGNLDDVNSVSNVDAGRRLVAEQERIMRRLYPHLAANSTQDRSRAPSSDVSRNDNSESNPSHSDPDAEDLDREDALFPSSTRLGDASDDRDSSDDNSRLRVPGADRPSTSRPSTPRPSTSAAQRPPTSYDPKTAPHPNQSRANLSRFRRRCAPILLYTSPRASDIVYSDGQRMRIDRTSNRLVPFDTLPPRYSEHGFPPPPPSGRPQMNRTSSEFSMDTASIALSREATPSENAPCPSHAPPPPPLPPIPQSESLGSLLTRTTTSQTTATSYETRTLAGKDLHLQSDRDSTRPKTSDGKKKRFKNWGHFIVPKLSPGVWAADCEGGAVVGWVGL